MDAPRSEVAWTAFRFPAFGLGCEIFAGAPSAVDAGDARHGYLAQSGADLALTIEFGPEVSLERWRAAVVNDPAVAATVVEDAPSTLCGLPARRLVVHVALAHPPPGDDGAPFRLAAAATVQRGTPLLATFRRALPDEPGAAAAEAHFFASLRRD